MKVEVGVYVRTKTGIHQIYRIDNNKTKYKYLYKLKKQDGDGCIDCGVFCEDDIIGEPSYEIIDLVQVGDYVNGIRIDNFTGNRFTGAKAISSNLLENKVGSKCYFFEEQDIKSIVTKEQFEAMAYKVVEE